MADYIAQGGHKIDDDELRQIIPARDANKEVVIEDGKIVIDTGKLDTALTQAEGEINGSLQGRYSVPHTSPLLPPWAVTLYRYYIYQNAATIPEDIQKAYDNVSRKLGKIASGQIDLDLKESNGEVIVIQNYDDTKFTMDMF